MKIGDKVFYGTDPRKMGFPLNPDDIGIVIEKHINAGVKYLTVKYPNPQRKTLCYAECDFTLYK